MKSHSLLDGTLIVAALGTALAIDRRPLAPAFAFVQGRRGNLGPDAGIRRGPASNVIVVAQASDYVGTAPGDKAGLRWKTKYGMVGDQWVRRAGHCRGAQLKGIGRRIFYFPGYGKYQEVNRGDLASPRPLGASRLPVGHVRHVEEAVEAARGIRVGDGAKEHGLRPPCHYIVNDANGHCVVLEYVDGELKAMTPLGVMTNSPTFDWHVTNLRNYVNLSVTNVPPVELAGIELPGLGQGSGMLGLPGDFTPPSRFVRAVAFSQSALPVETAREGVLQAFHLLNQFDIPRGAARAGARQVGGRLHALDGRLGPEEPGFYFRTFDNSRIRMVDLKKMDLDAKEIKTFPMGGEEIIEDLSGAAK